MEDETGFKRAVRPVLFEDRVLGVEQKFFCDRTTEKTVTLTVRSYDELYKTFFLFGEGQSEHLIS